MGARSNADEIDEAAAGWAARLDRRDLTSSEQSALDRWLAADVRHHGAFVRARSALTMLDGMTLAADAPSSIRPPAPPRVSRRMFWAGGVAAAAAAAGGVLFLGRESGLQVFETQDGEIRRLTFAGGAELVLDARSRIRTALSRGMQTVNLDFGRAAFDLRRAPATPVLVKAGDLRLQAQQASFSAAREAETVDLLVTAGTVEAWDSAHDDADRLHLGGGTKAVLMRASLVEQAVLSEADMERAEAWKIGRLALDGETVAEAVAIFNRHNRMQLVVTSPTLARETLVGYFHLNDPSGFAHALEATFGARSRQDAGRLILD